MPISGYHSRDKLDEERDYALELSFSTERLACEDMYDGEDEKEWFLKELDWSYHWQQVVVVWLLYPQI